VILLPQQRNLTPAPTTYSEMTEFEEESSVDSTSVEFNGITPMSTGSGLPRNDGNNTKILTSDLSANVSVSASKRSHTSHSIRRDTSRGSHSRSPEQDYHTSED
jgi:hypothetical protein